AHQPASSSSRAAAHSSTNDSTRRWYSPALQPTLRLCPLSGISLTTTRRDEVNNEATASAACGVDSQTRSWSATLNCTGTVTRPAIPPKSRRGQFAVTSDSYGAPGAESPLVSTSCG